MNKAAAKEPSMDEILSSIRQIIADDDDADVAPSAEVAPEPDPVEDLMAEAAVPAEIEEESLEPEIAEAPEDEALALSAEQIISDDVAADDDDPMAALAEDESIDVPELVEPDDIAFDLPEDEPEEPIADEPVAAAPDPAPEPAAAMPDPSLSADMAEQLLEPATGAAVKETFAKLSHVALGAHNLTIENMIREMLRPMLKDWLDENLPTVVEKMVEKEIERISRGG
jgi:cell pole-organizing protein PopZ